LQQENSATSQLSSGENDELKLAVADLNREKINLMRELTLKHEAYLKVK